MTFVKLQVLHILEFKIGHVLYYVNIFLHFGGYQNKRAKLWNQSSLQNKRQKRNKVEWKMGLFKMNAGPSKWVPNKKLPCYQCMNGLYQHMNTSIPKFEC